MCGCEQGSGSVALLGWATSSGVSIRQAPTSGAVVGVAGPVAVRPPEAPGERQGRGRQEHDDAPDVRHRTPQPSEQECQRCYRVVRRPGPARGLASARARGAAGDRGRSSRRRPGDGRGLRRRPGHPLAGATRPVPATRSSPPTRGGRTSLPAAPTSPLLDGEPVGCGVLGPARLPGVRAAADRGDPVLRPCPGPPPRPRGDRGVGDAPGAARTRSSGTSPASAPYAAARGSGRRCCATGSTGSGGRRTSRAASARTSRCTSGSASSCAR